MVGARGADVAGPRLEPAREVALAAGASLHARDDQGFTALHLVAREHDLALARALVARGADPWAGSYGPADGSRPIGFFGPEQAEELAALARAGGLAAPDTDPFAILTTAAERGVASYATHLAFPEQVDARELGERLRAGAPVADLWPTGLTVAPSQFCSEEVTELRDLLEGGPTGFLVSAALARRLESLASLASLASGRFELLPLALMDRAGAVREQRFALHVLAVPALELARCYPKHNLLVPARVDDVAVHALHPEAAALPLFRARELPRPVFLARRLLPELAAFSGLAVFALRR